MLSKFSLYLRWVHSTIARISKVLLYYFFYIIITVYKNFFVCFVLTVPPNILDSYSTESTIAVREHQNVTLTCKADGFPTPTLMWRREDTEAIFIERRMKGKLFLNLLRLEKYYYDLSNTRRKFFVCHTFTKSRSFQVLSAGTK